MQDKVQEIVDLLDRADDLFRALSLGMEQAHPIWESGLDKLSAALWLVEKLSEGSVQQGKAPVPEE